MKIAHIISIDIQIMVNWNGKETDRWAEQWSKVQDFSAKWVRQVGGEESPED